METEEPQTNRGTQMFELCLVLGGVACGDNIMSRRGGPWAEVLERRCRVCFGGLLGNAPEVGEWRLHFFNAAPLDCTVVIVKIGGG